MFYAPSVLYAHEWDFSASRLLIIELISPLVSIGVVLAAWVSGGFWVFTFIMGNPDGTERCDDGRDAVLSVRNWWEKFLLKATRKQAVSSSRSSVWTMAGGGTGLFMNYASYVVLYIWYFSMALGRDVCIASIDADIGLDKNICRFDC